jgi:hypothetical protein
MPVRIIRKKIDLPAPLEEAPAPPESGPAGASPHPRGWQFEDAVLLRKMDFSDEQGKAKFLLHLIKARVWYRVRGFDEETRRLRLAAQTGYEFDSRVDTTVDVNYLMVVLPEEAKEPSPELLDLVHRKGAALQTSAKEMQP